MLMGVILATCNAYSAAGKPVQHAHATFAISNDTRNIIPHAAYHLDLEVWVGMAGHTTRDDVQEEVSWILVGR